MKTLRERIRDETRNTKTGGPRWLDPELGRFITSENPGLLWSDECRSEAVLRKYPNNDDLEAAYARWLIEKGD